MLDLQWIQQGSACYRSIASAAKGTPFKGVQAVFMHSKVSERTTLAYKSIIHPKKVFYFTCELLSKLLLIQSPTIRILYSPYLIPSCGVETRPLGLHGHCGACAGPVGLARAIHGSDSQDSRKVRAALKGRGRRKRKETAGPVGAGKTPQSYVDPLKWEGARRCSRVQTLGAWSMETT